MIIRVHGPPSRIISPSLVTAATWVAAWARLAAACCLAANRVVRWVVAGVMYDQEAWVLHQQSRQVAGMILIMAQGNVEQPPQGHCRSRRTGSLDHQLAAANKVGRQVDEQYSLGDRHRMLTSLGLALHSLRGQRVIVLPGAMNGTLAGRGGRVTREANKAGRRAAV
jgi:hypothetical protein